MLKEIKNEYFNKNYEHYFLNQFNRKEGEYKEYSNGIITIGQYKNGKKIGIWKIENKNDNTITTEYYEKNLIRWSKKNRTNGVLLSYKEYSYDLNNIVCIEDNYEDNIYTETNIFINKILSKRFRYYKNKKLKQEAYLINTYFQEKNNLYLVKEYWENGNIKYLFTTFNENHYDEEGNLKENYKIFAYSKIKTEYQNNFKIKKSTYPYFDPISYDKILDGIYHEFYNNGNLKIEKYYVKNELQGLLKEYWENGNLKRMEQYLDNKKIGTTLIFNENGEPILD